MRHVGEADLAMGRDALLSPEAPVHGMLLIAGPPSHSFADLFFVDLVAGAGALWRASTLVSEPGTSTEFALPDTAIVVHLEHTDRVLLVASFGANGESRSVRSYDPFSFIAGLEAACLCFEHTLRHGGYNEAARRFYGYYARNTIEP